MSRRTPKHIRKGGNKRAPKLTALQIALKLVRAHIDRKASIAPNGQEIWYFDERLGGLCQLGEIEAWGIVDDLYGT